MRTIRFLLQPPTRLTSASPSINSLWRRRGIARDISARLARPACQHRPHRNLDRVRAVVGSPATANREAERACGGRWRTASDTICRSLSASAALCLR
jgi:hypothetical protein